MTVQTKSKCRAKQPSRCPHHGAPLVIATMQEKLQTGGALSQKEVAEYLEATEQVKHAEQARGALILAASRASNMSQAEALVVADKIENAEDIEPLLAELSRDRYGKNNSAIAVKILNNHKGLSTKEAQMALDLVNFYDRERITRVTEDKTTLKILMQKAENGDLLPAEEAGLMGNRSLPKENKKVLLERKPGHALEYIGTHGYDEQAEKSAVEFLANPKMRSSENSKLYPDGEFGYLVSRENKVSYTIIQNTKNPSLAQEVYEKHLHRSRDANLKIFKMESYNAFPIEAIKNPAFDNKQIPSLVRDSYAENAEIIKALKARPNPPKELIEKLKDKESRPYSAGVTESEKESIKSLNRALRSRYGTYATDHKKYYELVGKQYATPEAYKRLSSRIAKFEAEGKTDDNAYNQAIINLSHADLYRDRQQQLQIFS